MAGKFHKNRRVAAAHTENFMNTKDKNDGRPSRDDAESFNKGNLTKIPGSGMLKQPLVLFHGTTFLAGDKKTVRAFIRDKR